MLNGMKDGGVSECAEGRRARGKLCVMMMLIREKATGVEQAMC